MAPLLPYAAIAVVVATVVTIVVVGLTRHSTPASASSLAPAAVVDTVATIPASSFEAAGVPAGAAPIVALPSGTPALTEGGLPEVFYVGADYCPYCAAQRWVIVTALSRFGRFLNLGATESSTTDIAPGTKTFSFYGSTYRSPYLAFTPVETETNQPAATGGYTTLQTLTEEQHSLLRTYDASPYVSGTPGTIPFVDIAGRSLVSGAMYDPSLLQGMTMEEISRAATDPSSPIGKAVLANANLLTAAICAATGGQPAAVCSSSVIVQATHQLPSVG